MKISEGKGIEMGKNQRDRRSKGKRKQNIKNREGGRAKRREIKKRSVERGKED